MVLWMIALILGCLALLYGVFFCVQRHRRKLLPPGPTSLPIIGNLHQLGLRPHETFMKMKKKYGNLISIDFAGYRGVVLNDAKVIREALNMPELSGRPSFYPFLARSGGDRMRGVALNTGPAGVEQRRFVLKTLRDFGFGKKTLELLMHDEITETIRTLSKFAGQPIKTQNFFNLAIINALWLIITGERYAHDDEKLQQLIKLITDSASNIPAAGAFFFFPWLCKIAPNLSGFNTFIGFQVKILELATHEFHNHKATFQHGHPRDYLDASIQEIMDTNNPNSSFYGKEGELNLCVTLLDLFGAGSETTSTTLSWLFVYVSIDQTVQDKMFIEIQKVVGLSRLPSLVDRQKMPYTEAIITEVLRISSIFPLSVFHESTETVSFQGYTIPKNTLIIPNIYGANHDPEYWGDPDVFRPERFISPDGYINRHHEALMPFSVGKRNCVGESLARDELFLFTASIFQKFSVVPNPAQPWPNPAELSSGIMRIPKIYEYILTDRC